MRARTGGLAFWCRSSRVFASIQLGTSPQALDPLSAFMLASPFRAAVVQWLFLALTVVLIHLRRARLRGQGQLCPMRFWSWSGCNC